MSEGIPKAIQDEFTLQNKDIKYPTYPDDDYQRSISEDINLNNYSEENTKKAFNDFLTIFTNCKKSIYEIIEKNLNKFQEYCHSLNEKTMNYIFYLYILEKFIILVQKKFYGEELTDNIKKELFCDDMIYECCNYNEIFSKLYKEEFKEQNDQNKIRQVFNPVIDRYNKILKSDNKIGNILIRTIKFLNKYLFVPLEEEINKFKKIIIFREENFFKSNINEENEIILLNVILYIKKLVDLDFAFYNASILDINDICNIEESSNEWKNLEKILFRVIPKNSEMLKQKMLESRGNPDLGLSIMSNAQVDASATSIIFSGIKNFVYYKSNENRSKIDSKRFQITNSLENMKGFIGLFKKFKFIFTKMIPKIEFRRKIYVKKELPPINRAYIERLINFMKGENDPKNSIRITESNNNINNNTLPIIYRDKVPDKKIKRNYVSVTILHTEKIFFKDEKNEGMFSSFFQFFKQEEQNAQINNQFRKNTIMITVHGGGFIGSSTLLHERYLRKWIKILNVPIFGINYSLAPEYPYPEALNDLYQAYMWILKHAKNELNMDIKHIIISGDSAGANLVLGLNNLLIVMKEFEATLQNNNFIFPELVLAQYPVTYVNLKNYSNSFLLSLNSQMLNVKGMKYMYEKYVGNYENEDEDPFLNPVKINDFILDRMKNKIRLFFGTVDVLRDDGIKFLYKFSKYNNKQSKINNIDIRGYDFIYLGHGFNGLSEDIQQIGRNVIIPEIEEFLNNII